MANDLNTSLNISVGGNFTRRLTENGRSLQRFSQNGQRELSRLQRTSLSLATGLDRLAGRYTAMITGVAATYASTRAVMESAKLDKSLIQIRQTAGATAKMTGLLRKELHEMSQQTGQSLDSLLGGFNNLIQAGMEWDQALLTIKAVNPAMAVTGAQAEVLTAALAVAGEAFDFDLSKPRLAADLLDQMTVAGRLGNAELEDLSGIFARVGVNANAANLSFSDTLGFIERLSLIERAPERLATLADSTLRLFTNQKYLEKAASVTGVSFYDADGQRREAFAVLDDIAAKFKTLKTDAAWDRALSATFGDTDLDTQRGLRTLLSGNAISEARAMSREIAQSTGAIGNDLEAALENSVDQVSRLKSALREAADEFSQPINDTIENAIKYLLDEKGLGLTGKEVMAGGAAAAVLGVGAVKGSSALLKRFGSTGVGVATGKALEEFTGVQPVFVVNMPSAGMIPPGPGVGPGSKTPGKSPGKWGAYAGMFGRVAGVAGLAVTAYQVLDAFADKSGGKKRTRQSYDEDGEFDAGSLIEGRSGQQRGRRGQQARAKLEVEVTDKRVNARIVNAEDTDISVDTGRVMQ